MKKPTQYQPMMPIGQSKASGNPSDATWWPTLQPLQVAMAMAMFTMYFSFMLFASCDGNGNVYNVLFNYALCKLYFALCTAAHLMPLQLSFQSVKAQHPLPPSQSIPLLKKLLKAQVCFKKTARKALKLEAMTVAHPVLTVLLLWKFSQHLYI